MGTHLRFVLVLAAAASLLSTALGCEARVSLGASCEFATDCPPPMVCKMGRCRSECREARDCPFPLECMMDNGVGGCRVSEDGACPRGTIDCADGLECLEGRCMQPCMDHSECADAQRCDGMGCERNVPDPGTCDVLSGAGCGGGERCAAEVSGSTTAGCVTLIAGEVRSQDLFAACSETEPCRDGLTCAAGRCLRWCELEVDAMGIPTLVPDSSCGVGSYCATSEVTGGRVPPRNLGYCTQPCDPTATGAAAGCLPEMNCGIAIPSAAYSSCEPRAETGGARWEACSNAACGPGLDCIHSVYAEGRCLGWCESDADCMDGVEGCALDLSHSVIDHTGAARRIGVCLPTCDAPIDCPVSLPAPLACPDGLCRGA